MNHPSLVEIFQKFNRTKGNNKQITLHLKDNKSLRRILYLKWK